MSKADFTHQIKEYGGRNVIVIEDLNIGGMSVTNDIENVVSDVAIMEKIEPEQYMIVYKDSEGIWDGWDAKHKVFVNLQEDTWKHAADKYITRQTFALA